MSKKQLDALAETPFFIEGFHALKFTPSSPILQLARNYLDALYEEQYIDRKYNDFLKPDASGNNGFYRTFCMGSTGYALAHFNPSPSKTDFFGHRADNMRNYGGLRGHHISPQMEATSQLILQQKELAQHIKMAPNPYRLFTPFRTRPPLPSLPAPQH